MRKQDITVRSAEGPAFDCHLVTPEGGATVPAVVLASTIHGVDADLCAIADVFAAHGCLVAAPDLFWRTHPGALARPDPRAANRAQPRLEAIRTGEQDLLDVLAAMRKLPSCNGRAAVIGFCYGGPYAILGPRRLGYDAGVACHGSAMLDFAGELEGVRQPVCIVWGEQDHLAPPPARDAYRALQSRMANLELHVLPGVRHGYMLQGRPDVFDRAAFAFTMDRALGILEQLR
ncbi:MAG: dienelactone hydrolase family protein [Ramlibacter sp.]